MRGSFLKKIFSVAIFTSCVFSNISKTAWMKKSFSNFQGIRITDISTVAIGKIWQFEDVHTILL